MGIIFAVRGDSFTARYAGGYNTPGLFATSAGNLPVVAADAGAIGGSILDLDKTAYQVHQVIYPARGNIGTTRTRSVLIRLALGTTATNIGFWNIGGIFSSNPNGCGVSLLGTNFRVQFYNEYAANLTNVNIGTWSPSTGTYYDIVLTTTGDGTANNTNVYIDGVLLGQTTAPNWTNPFDPTLLTQIVLGAMSFDVNNTRIKVNEFVVWDSVIDPTSVTLTGGTGSLQGAARTEFVDVTSFNGLNYTDPGIASVKTGTNYIFAGSTLTGTYTGSDRWSDPGASNVISGVNYLVDAVTTTGSFVATDPGVSNVRLGTSYVYAGSTLTGTLVVPTADSGATGTCDLNAIKENIRYVLDQANTTTASPVDLSANLTQRVQKVLKVNPLMIPMQTSFYPMVTCYISSKSMEQADMSKNQLLGRKKATISVEVVGAVLNENFVRDTEDPADEDINYLMENIELTLRAYPDFAGKVKWQISRDVDYYSEPLDEQTHLRAGILRLEGTVFY